MRCCGGTSQVLPCRLGAHVAAVPEAHRPLGNGAAGARGSDRSFVRPRNTICKVNVLNTRGFYRCRGVARLRVFEHLRYGYCFLLR